MRNGLLSQTEVNRLKNGTKVWIYWTGGNGPHKYTIETQNKVAWAKECDSVIDYVGYEVPRTLVALSKKPILDALKNKTPHPKGR